MSLLRIALVATVSAVFSMGCGSDSATPRVPGGASGAGASGESGAGNAGTAAGNSGEGGAGASAGDGAGEGGSAGTVAGEGGAGAGTSGVGGSSVRVFDAGDAPDRNDVGPGTLCDRLSTIQCAGEAYCCDDPGRDFAACKAVMQEGCQNQLMFDALAGDDLTAFSAEHARLAFTEIERRASICDPQIAAFGESVDGLRGMFKGTRAPDTSCLALNPTFREEAAKALASCLDPASNSCLPTSLLSWSCKARAGTGGRCFSDVNCTEGLFCDNPNFALSGSTCMTRKSVGADCELPNECTSLFCKGGKCVEANAQTAYCLTD